eukprot:m.30642 g.30642  ORF g.30642 m.30642 type:complete len:564 (+) comp31372_c0_seq1:46-1737(+)
MDAVNRYVRNQKECFTHIGKNQYVGEKANGLRNGYGVYIYSNTFFRYEGEWKDGKKHGHGKLVMGDGSYYEGNFRDGEICCHGFRLWASTGNQFEGQFEDGEMTGQGVMKYGDGGIYEGNWLENKHEGVGILTDGDRRGVYKGAFHGHKRHGYGKQVYADGNEYDGDWISGMRQGHGVLRGKDGTVYEGQWRQDVKHGAGTLRHCSGMVCEAIWANDRPSDEAVKIIVKGPSEVTRNDHSIILEIACVNSDGEAVEGESGRRLKISAGFASSEALLEDAISTPFGFSVKPCDIKSFIPDALTGDSNFQPEIRKRRSFTPDQSLQLEIDIEPPTPHPPMNEDAAVPDSPPLGSLAPSIAASALQTHSTPSLAQSIDGLDVFFQPVPVLSTVKGEATVNGLAFPPPPPPPPPAIVEAISRVETPEVSGKLSKDSTPSTSKHSLKDSRSSTPSKLKGSRGQSRKSSSLMASNASSKTDVSKGGKKVTGKEKESKGSEDSSRYCKIGDYVIFVSDVTEPPFLGERLETGCLHVKVTKEKKSKRGVPRPLTRLNTGSRASVISSKATD